jgi:hypothetical protein
MVWKEAAPPEQRFFVFRTEKSVEINAISDQLSRESHGRDFILAYHHQHRLK